MDTCKLYICLAAVLWPNEITFYAQKSNIFRKHTLARVIVSLMGKRSWTEAKPHIHRQTWNTSQLPLNPSPKMECLQPCARVPKSWLEKFWLYSSRHLLIPNTRLPDKKLLQGKTQPITFQSHSGKEIEKSGNREAARSTKRNRSWCWLFFPHFLPPKERVKEPLSEPIVSFVLDQSSQNSSRKQLGSSLNRSGCPLAGIEGWRVGVGDKKVKSSIAGTIYKWKIHNPFLSESEIWTMPQ